MWWTSVSSNTIFFNSLAMETLQGLDVVYFKTRLKKQKQKGQLKWPCLCFKRQLEGTKVVSQFKMVAFYKVFSWSDLSWKWLFKRFQNRKDLKMGYYKKNDLHSGHIWATNDLLRIYYLPFVLVYIYSNCTTGIKLI